MLDLMLGQVENVVEKAESGRTILWSIIGAGSATTFVGAIIGKLIMRSIKEVLDHVKNPLIHLKAGNGYVSESTCDKNVVRIEKKIDDASEERKNENIRLHDRLDQVQNQQAQSSEKILTAILTLKK